MKSLVFGDIALLKFPFSDGKNSKKRPVFVIRDFKDGDVLVCRITSKSHESKYDVKINDWEGCVLKLPSVIRVHKLAALEKEMVQQIIGKKNNATQNLVKKVFSSIVS